MGNLIGDWWEQTEETQPTVTDKLSLIGEWIKGQAKNVAPMLFPSEWERYANMNPLERQGALGQSALDLLQPTMFVGPKATGFKDMVQFSNMADRMPRAEISDVGMKMKLNNLYKIGDTLNTVPNANSPTFSTDALLLKDVIEHPEVLDKYGKELNNIRVFGQIGKGNTPHGSYGENTIKAFAENPEDFKSILLHEIQHAIQEKEGWARGGSPEEFGKLRNWASGKTQDLLEDINFIKTHPQEYGNELPQILKQKQIELEQLQSIANTSNSSSYYNRLAGEIEARNTASRMNLTPQERLSKMPYESQGIHLEDWIVNKK